MTKRKTAGELSKKASSDTTNYNLLELGHAKTDDVMEEIRKCIAIHNPIFDEDEYCIVRQLASDPLIKNLNRAKYYGWLYLPSPRPNQAVFLYNKKLDTIKRLWVLPDAPRMAQLASTNNVVEKKYETMQAWSVAFYKGTFWDFIRYQHDITMLSEHEFFLAHRDELIKAGCKIPTSDTSHAFDFSKIHIKNVADSSKSVID